MPLDWSPTSRATHAQQPRMSERPMPGNVLCPRSHMQRSSTGTLMPTGKDLDTTIRSCEAGPQPFFPNTARSTSFPPLPTHSQPYQTKPSLPAHFALPRSCYRFCNGKCCIIGVPGTARDRPYSSSESSSPDSRVELPVPSPRILQTRRNGDASNPRTVFADIRRGFHVLPHDSRQQYTRARRVLRVTMPR